MEAAALLRLLGDDTRLRLIRVLAREPLNVSELTAVLGVAQSGVSRHLGLLREAGLEDVRIRAATLALQGAHPAKRLLVDLAETHRAEILRAGMAEHDLAPLMLACDAIARDPATVVISFGMTQVWGRKPGRASRR